MRAEETGDNFDKYAEQLRPARVSVQQKRGRYLFVFDVAGYRGVDTGETYITRNTKYAIEAVTRSLSAQGELELSAVVPGVMLAETERSTLSFSKFWDGKGTATLEKTTRVC